MGSEETNGAEISPGETGGTIDPYCHVQIYHKTAIARFGVLLAKKYIVNANVAV